MPWLSRRPRPCLTHSKASPMRIARLEEETGIRPGAVAELLAAGLPLVETYSDPNLIDCGDTRCRAYRAGRG